MVSVDLDGNALDAAVTWREASGQLITPARLENWLGTVYDPPTATGLRQQPRRR